MKRILIYLFLLLPLAGYSQLTLPYSIKVNNPVPLDYYYGPWADVATAKSSVPEAIRYDGLTVMIAGVGEYHWLAADLTDTGLVAKTSGVTDGSGTTANGTAVDLGGLASDNVSLDGQFSYYFDVLDFWRFKVATDDLQLLVTAPGDWRVGGTDYDITGNGTTNKLTINTTGAVDLLGRGNIVIDNYAGALGTGTMQLSAYNSITISSHVGGLDASNISGNIDFTSLGGFINFEADGNLDFLSANGDFTVDAAGTTLIQGNTLTLSGTAGIRINNATGGGYGTIGQVLTNDGFYATWADPESKIITSRDVTTASASVQSDNKRIVWLNSGTAFDFTLDQLTTNTVIDFVNIGAGTVTFINGTGVTLVGTATLVSGATATVIYRSTTSPYVIQ